MCDLHADSRNVTQCHDVHRRPIPKWMFIFTAMIIASAVTILLLSFSLRITTFSSIFTDTAIHCQTLHMNTKTPVNSFKELFHAVANIGDWEGLCWNLDVDEATINRLKYSDYVRPESKKQDCLQAYWNSGEANWETVIHAVAGYPIKNVKLAKKIAKRHKIKYICTTREDI